MRPAGGRAPVSRGAVFTDAAMVRRVLVVTAIVGVSRGLFGVLYEDPGGGAWAVLLVAASSLLAVAGLALPGRPVPVLFSVALAAVAAVPSFGPARVPLATGLSVVLSLGLGLAAAQAVILAVRRRRSGAAG